MPLQPESLIKIYRGTHCLGEVRPVLVVTADTTDPNNLFGEYYIFHKFPDMPFLYARATCAHPDNLYLYDFGKFPEVFSAPALLETQFRAAQDCLEHEVSIRDKSVTSDLFHSGAPMTYQETGDAPLIEFAMFQRFPREREIMFKFSKSRAIAALLEKLLELPEALLTIEPKT